MIRPWIVATLFAACLASSVALALSPDRPLNRYVHDSWTKREGLPVNSVTDLAQDASGYLWLATPGGLVRFDGLRFEVFDASNVPAFDNNVVEAVRVDDLGDLWIGGPSGLFVRRDGIVIPVLDPDGRALPHVNRIALGRDGSVWASHAGGVATVKDGKARDYRLPDGTSPGRCSAMHFAADGAAWFAGSRLVRVADSAMDVFWSSEPPKIQPTSFAETAEGTIWIGTRGAGLGRYDALRRFVTLPGTEGLAVFRIHAAEDALWFASLGRGLGRAQGGGVEFLGSREGLVSDDAFTVFEDREGTLWFGTQSGGLNRLRDAPFTTLSVGDGLPHRAASSVFQDRDGDIWIATSGGGVLQRSGDRSRTWGAADGLGSPAVMTVEQDRSGRIWAGTGNAGVYVLEDGRFRRVTRDGVDPVIGVFALLPDPRGGMLVGGSGGMIWTDGRRVEERTDAFRGTGWFATGAAFQGETLWVGSMASGLMRIEGESATILGADQGLAADGIIAVHVDDRGRLWIGTYGGGLQLRDGETWRTFRARDGLCEDVVYSILEDEQGRFWLGGNRGVCRVDRQALVGRAADVATPVRSVLYGREEGIAAAECSGGPRTAAWRMADGTLWFATPDGVAWVDPALVTDAGPGPRAVVEGLECEGRAYGNGADLPPGTGGCELRFTAPLADRAADVSFRYRLEGLDDRWVQGGDARSASYGHLGAGRYTFSVLAVGADGTPGEAAATMNFRVLPEYHETVGFRIGVVAAALLAAAGAYRFRVRRLVAQRSRLEREVDERTRDLKRVTDRLAETNRTLERRVEQGIEALRRSERMAAYGTMVAHVAHEVRHPIFALQAAGYVLVDRLRDESGLAPQLRTLELETRRMGALMEELLQFARPGELRRAPESIRSVIDEAVEVVRAEHVGAPLTIEVRADRELPEIEIDRQRFVQVIVNLLANALRHAGGAHVVTVEAGRSDPGEAGSVRVRVCDDGAGLDEGLLESVFEPFVTSGNGTGLGLAIVKRIVDDHGGAIRAFNRECGGACFEIVL